MPDNITKTDDCGAQNNENGKSNVMSLYESAELGNVEAMYNLGEAYELGRNVEKTWGVHSNVMKSQQTGFMMARS